MNRTPTLVLALFLALKNEQENKTGEAAILMGLTSQVWEGGEGPEATVWWALLGSWGRGSRGGPEEGCEPDLDDKNWQACSRRRSRECRGPGSSPVWLPVRSRKTRRCQIVRGLRGLGQECGVHSKCDKIGSRVRGLNLSFLKKILHSSNFTETKED